VITATADGKPFDDHDAQLVLSPGVPRFYLMTLKARGRHFHRITRHQRCTQCLGSLGGKSWFMAVCPPSQGDRPDLAQLRAFTIPGSCFIKLHVGTWHAGPYFEPEAGELGRGEEGMGNGEGNDRPSSAMVFYNLELSDTNVTDHQTYDWATQEGLSFEIQP